MSAVRVISLARHVERREEFRRRNGHIDHTFFDGVDGVALTTGQIEATGLFDRTVWTDYGPHGLGAALSHHALWLEAAAGTEPLTIAEDDAVFRRDFDAQRREVLAALPPEWDIMLWGWNFDTVLQVEPIGSVSPVGMVFDQPQLRNSLDVFQELDSRVQVWPVVLAFGLLAYTLSPAGAAKFLKLCFPQKPSPLYVPILNYHVRNVGLDVSTNHIYRDTNSFVCFPPLAVSPNQRAG
jgi:glycosyl transferase, family 25